MSMGDNAVITELLASLAAREQALYSYTVSLVGTLEFKNQHLEEAGIFAAYDELYAQYLAACQRAAEGLPKLELLKRLTFLSWYSLLRPSFLTGIGALTPEGIFATYELLDAHLRAAAGPGATLDAVVLFGVGLHTAAFFRASAADFNGLCESC